MGRRKWDQGTTTWLVQHILSVTSKERLRSCDISAVPPSKPRPPPLHGFRHNPGIVWFQGAFCSKRWWDLLHQISAKTLSNVGHEEEDTALKTRQILFLMPPTYTVTPSPSWKTEMRDSSACCKPSLPLAWPLEACGGLDFPRTSIPFSAQSWVCSTLSTFGCSAEWKTWPQDWKSKASCWKSGTSWDVGLLLVKIWL